MVHITINHYSRSVSQSFLQLRFEGRKIVFAMSRLDSDNKCGVNIRSRAIVALSRPLSGNWKTVDHRQVKNNTQDECGV